MPVDFEHIHGTFRGTLGDRIQREADPVTRLQRFTNRVILDMIDPDSLRVDIHVPQDFQRPFGPADLVLQMGRMNQDQLIML